MNPLTYARLSVMMFAQYAVWGAWLPLAGQYLGAPAADGGLGFDGHQVGLLLGLGGSIGAVLAPFFAGQIADRYFRTERCLAVLLAIGGVIIWTLAHQRDFQTWLWLSIAYSFVFMPTLALSNSLAFAHLPNRDRQFPYVRLWGTIGWIAASWAFPMIWLQTDLQFRSLPPFLVGTQMPDATAKLANMLKFSGMISIGYALYCLTLPATPPKRDAVARLAFAKAFTLLFRPSFAVLMLVCLPISMIHTMYFIQTAKFLASPAVGLTESQIGPAMTIGQFAEFLVMPFLGLMLARLGFRKVLAIGCLAYAARFAVFGTPGLPVPMVLSAFVFHGFCYACFFAATFIYVDRIAPQDVRHSAQTLVGILILGGGPILGGYLNGLLQTNFTSAAGAVNFSALWYTLAAIGLASAGIIALAFRDETKGAVPAEKADAAAALETV